ncbi:MAG: type II toxin-antitoxin system VapC family toxin [Coriobacteriales bacterium]|jgi:predicted nucleic acid-binding protein
MHRLMLDTNILLDCVDSRRAAHDDALRLIARCNGGGDMGIASSHSLNDVYYIMKKLYGEPSARKAVDVLTDLVVIGPISAEETLLALGSNEPDFEDGLVRACAELNDVDFIISRDEKAFGKATIRRLTSAEYLEIAED